MTVKITGLKGTVDLVLMVNNSEIDSGVYNFDGDSRQTVSSSEEITFKLKFDKNKALFNVNISDISPASVEPGELITITANISNNGNIEGLQDIIMTVDWGSEKISDTKSLKLEAGTSDSVTYSNIAVPDNAVLGETKISVVSNDDSAESIVEVGKRIVFIEQSGLEGVTVEIYNNKDYAAENKLGEIVTASNGQVVKYLRNDESYWYKGISDGVSLKDSFTVTGDKSIKFRLDFAGGYGTEAAPFKIANWFHLNNIRKYGVIDAEKYSPGTYFNLVTNLDQNSTGYQELIIDTQNDDNSYRDGFEPIGIDNQKDFSGVFDGQGHKIKDLYIYVFNHHAAALFFAIDTNAVIHNMGLENADISGIGCIYVGGLAGKSEGLIKETYCIGDVEGGMITGGLLGCNYGGEINNTYFQGTVSGAAFAGGLLGDNNGGQIRNSYAVGEVEARDDEFEPSGFVYSNINEGIISNCYYDKNVSGLNDTGKGKPISSFKMVQEDTYEGWNFDDIWNIDSGSTYPYLRNNQQTNLTEPSTFSVKFEESSGAEASMIIYSDAEHLKQIGEPVCLSDGTACIEMLSGQYWYTITADGYQDYNGSFEVDQEDTIVNITLIN
ncbi:MAG: hypothetical protein ACOCRZ_06935 [Halothermotrichaceae bacterium]